MSDEPTNMPFATMPPKHYVRMSQDANKSNDPSALYIALTQSPDPHAWTAPKILEPLLKQLRDSFGDADVVRHFDDSPVVSADEMVPLEGTDKPAVLDASGEPVMFSRITTPRYCKDLAEMRLTPRRLDELIAGSGAELARAMADLFLHNLHTNAKLTDLWDIEELSIQPALTRDEHSFVGHPDVIKQLYLWLPHDGTHAHAFKGMKRNELYAIPNTADITYRRLDEPGLWLEREAYMVEFFCHVTVGATLRNIEGLRRFTWPRTEGEESCED